MAVAFVNGATNSATGVTTITVTYSPTTGNTVVVFIQTTAANLNLTLTVKDSANNVLSAGPVRNTAYCFFQVSAPAGITSYTVTGITTPGDVAIAAVEYSGAAGVSTITAAANANSASASVSLTLQEANNFVVAGLGASNTLTTTVGNQRKQTTANTARIVVQDNTAASITSVTNTATLTSTQWNAVAVELGGTGRVRTSQDVSYSITGPTTAKIRDSQDPTLAITRPTTAKVRASQDVTLLVCFVLPYNAALEPKADEQYIRWPGYYQAIGQGADDGAIQARKRQFPVTFVTT